MEHLLQKEDVNDFFGLFFRYAAPNCFRLVIHGKSVGQILVFQLLENGA